MSLAASSLLFPELELEIDNNAMYPSEDSLSTPSELQPLSADDVHLLECGRWIQIKDLVNCISDVGR